MGNGTFKVNFIIGGKGGIQYEKALKDLGDLYYNCYFLISFKTSLKSGIPRFLLFLFQAK